MSVNWEEIIYKFDGNSCWHEVYNILGNVTVINE
jgi:hypothetical protein